MNPNHSFVSRRAVEKCEYCHAPEDTCGFPFEIDHFIPKSQGGSDTADNLVLACRSCNLFKAFHQQGILKESVSVRLFNPRVDEWDDHFRLAPETAEYVGLTDVGAGTINRLRMNSVFQLRARRFWLNVA